VVTGEPGDLVTANLKTGEIRGPEMATLTMALGEMEEPEVMALVLGVESGTTVPLAEMVPKLETGFRGLVMEVRVMLEMEEVPMMVPKLTTASQVLAREVTEAESSSLELMAMATAAAILLVGQGVAASGSGRPREKRASNVLPGVAVSLLE